jgi:DNA mismatch endonuclease (patch repair protein)
MKYPLRPLTVPPAVSEARSRNMAAIRSSGNKSTEVAMVAALRGAGVTGWRRRQNLPGRPDFAWGKEKIALFVDGCYWHGCPACYQAPRSHSSYWRQKLARNQMRDRYVTRFLRKQGWKVIRVWECRLGTVRTTNRILDALAERRREVPLG